MCTGVRQLNPEFVRKDFLETTGIRKESGGWKREAERDPREMRTGIFLSTPASFRYSQNNEIILRHSKINCKCKLPRKLERAYNTHSWNIIIPSFDREKARIPGIKLEKRARNICIRVNILYNLTNLWLLLYIIFFSREKSKFTNFYFIFKPHVLRLFLC